METVELNFSDWIGITSDGLFRVNKTQYFNPKYFTLIAANNTQRDVINRLQRIPKPPITSKKPIPKTTSDLDFELDQLVTIARLKKKLITHSNNLNIYRDYSRWNKDKALLKLRSILKGKKIIKNYLEKLRDDVNFNISRIDKGIITLNYLGKYASCKRTVSF